MIGQTAPSQIAVLNNFKVSLMFYAVNVYMHFVKKKQT